MPRPERTGVIVLAAQSGVDEPSVRSGAERLGDRVVGEFGDVPSARRVAHDRRTPSGGRIDAEDIPKAHPSTEMLDVRAELASRAKPSQADVVGLASGRDVSHRGTECAVSSRRPANTPSLQCSATSRAASITEPMSPPYDAPSSSNGVSATSLPDRSPTMPDGTSLRTTNAVGRDARTYPVTRGTAATAGSVQW